MGCGTETDLSLCNAPYHTAGTVSLPDVAMQQHHSCSPLVKRTHVSKIHLVHASMSCCAVQSSAPVAPAPGACSAQGPPPRPGPAQQPAGKQLGGASGLLSCPAAVGYTLSAHGNPNPRHSGATEDSVQLHQDFTFLQQCSNTCWTTGRQPGGASSSYFVQLQSYSPHGGCLAIYGRAPG